MTERIPTFREAASILLDKQSTHNVRLRHGRTPGDLVRAVISSEMYSRPLTGDKIRSNDETDGARNWRFIVPIENNGPGIAPIEFGLSLEQQSGDALLNRLNAEQLFDEAIDATANPTVANIFNYVGGDIAEKVYENDRPFFAGLERRTRVVNTDEGEQLQYWIQLVYPIELKKSLEAVQRKNAFMRKQGKAPSKWMEQAAKSSGSNRLRVADAMALSVFWLAKRHMETEHQDGEGHSHK